MIFWKYYDGAKSVCSIILMETQWKRRSFVFFKDNIIIVIYLFLFTYN